MEMGNCEHRPVPSGRNRTKRRAQALGTSCASMAAAWPRLAKSLTTAACARARARAALVVPSSWTVTPAASPFAFVALVTWRALVWGGRGEFGGGADATHSL